MATILIVGDARESLVLLGGVLRPLYHVRTVNSGQGALRAATRSPRPDLILLDVALPEMDGYEVMRRLHAQLETEDIPVLLVTAVDNGEDEALGLALGAVDYISEPIKPAIVIARIATHLELSRHISNSRRRVNCCATVVSC